MCADLTLLQIAFLWVLVSCVMQYARLVPLCQMNLLPLSQMSFIQNIGTYQPNYIAENYDLYLEFLCLQDVIL